MKKINNQKRQQTKPRKSELVNKVVNSFSQNVGKTLNYRQLAKIIGVKDETQRILLSEIMYELHLQGILEEVSKG